MKGTSRVQVEKATTQGQKPKSREMVDVTCILDPGSQFN